MVLEDRRPDDGKLLENAEFLRFAHHWGFRFRACRPFRAKTKGKAERPVGYVRPNFVYGHEFLGDTHLNAQAAQWLERTANVRVHGTTGAVPRDRFAQEERAALQPLAARSYQSVLPLPACRRVQSASAPHQRPLSPWSAGRSRPMRSSQRAAHEGGYRVGPASGSGPSSPSSRCPGALEALDDILRQLDGGALTAPASLEALLGAQISL